MIIMSHEKERVIGRVGELQSLITPKLDTFLNGLQDAQYAMTSKEPSDLRSAEMKSYLFNDLISILESLKKGWDSHLDSLKKHFC